MHADPHRPECPAQFASARLKPLLTIGQVARLRVEGTDRELLACVEPRELALADSSSAITAAISACAGCARHRSGDATLVQDLFCATGYNEKQP
jgi:hypothetical protein